jgi:putative endonuclease
MLRCIDSSLYTGITIDLHRRIDEHNSSDKGAKYTKSRRPVVLVYSEEYGSKTEAMQREIKLKKLSRSQKESLISKNNLEV